MIQRTSVETYHAIKDSGVLSEKRMRVFDIFFENPEGLTGAEVSDIYKSKFPSSKYSETIRNRITELAQMGVLTELGTVECQFTKRKVMRWCCVDNMPIPLEKKLTRKEKIQSVLKDIENFGKQLTSEEDKIVLRLIYKKVQNI